MPDEAVEALVAIGAPALEPLLDALCTNSKSPKRRGRVHSRESAESATSAFSKVLLDRLEFDLSDTALLLGIYGDPAAIPALEQRSGESGSRRNAS